MVGGSPGHRARLDAGEMRGVMGEAAGGPELAVADAIDPDLDLSSYCFRDSWRDLPGDDRGIRYLGSGKPPRYLLPTLGRRQPADIMRGSDPPHAPLHVPFLPGPAECNPEHDNTIDIAIEPVAGPTSEGSGAGAFRDPVANAMVSSQQK